VEGKVGSAAAVSAARWWSGESSTTAHRPRPSTARTTPGSHFRATLPSSNDEELLEKESTAVPVPVPLPFPLPRGGKQTQTLTRSPVAKKHMGRRAAKGARGFEGTSTRDNCLGSEALEAAEARGLDASALLGRRAFFALLDPLLPLVLPLLQLFVFVTPSSILLLLLLLFMLLL